MIGSQNKQVCQYHGMETRGTCGWRVYSQNEQLCVFHSRTRGREAVFGKEFKSYLEKVESDDEITAYDFSGFNFPALFSREHFINIEFKKPAIFRRAVFEGNTNFTACLFRFKAVFSRARFTFVDFSDAVFMGDVDFLWTVFSDSVFLGSPQIDISGNSETEEKIHFQGNLNFQDATFEGPVKIYGVDFRRRADFTRCQFKASLNIGLSEIQSQDGKRLQEALFHGPTDFTGAIFKEEANFIRVQFRDTVTFRNARFEGSVYFKGVNENKCFGDKESDFRGLVLGPNGILTFEKINLGKARFFDTNATPIHFRDVQWYDDKLRKRALWEEFRPLETNESERDYEKIAENYGQLVLNHERKRDYEAAEDFHIGEMEMRRKKKGVKGKKVFSKTVKEWFNGYNLYRLLSNYGTSYWRAFSMLLVMMLAFSFFFLFCGFQTSEKLGNVPLEKIEYNVNSDQCYQGVSLWQWFCDYGKAIMLTLSILTFQRERFYEPIDWQGRLLLYGSVVFLASQAALLLLAIRRRFKR